MKVRLGLRLVVVVTRGGKLWSASLSLRFRQACMTSGRVYYLARDNYPCYLGGSISAVTSTTKRYLLLLLASYYEEMTTQTVTPGNIGNYRTGILEGKLRSREDLRSHAD